MVEITLQPLRRMEVDAAIVFSDIMVPLAGVGVDVRIEPGRGPVVDTPMRTAADVDRLRPLEPEADVPEVLEAIGLLRDELAVPLIGFAGAPFTLASYLVEGEPSRSHERTKALMHGDPATWDSLMRALVAIVVPHLRAQAAAGAQALQVFDSWVGALDADDYRPSSAAVHARPVRRARAISSVPVIHFGVGTGELLGPMAAAGRRRDRSRLAHAARRRLGPCRGGRAGGRAGEPRSRGACSRPGSRSRPRRARCSRAPPGADGHVFNLGHGVLPATPPDTLRRLVDLVHSSTERSAA